MTAVRLRRVRVSIRPKVEDRSGLQGTVRATYPHARYQTLARLEAMDPARVEKLQRTGIDATWYAETLYEPAIPDGAQIVLQTGAGADQTVLWVRKALRAGRCQRLFLHETGEVQP